MAIDGKNIQTVKKSNGMKDLIILLWFCLFVFSLNKIKNEKQERGLVEAIMFDIKLQAFDCL